MPPFTPLQTSKAVRLCLPAILAAACTVDPRAVTVKVCEGIPVEQDLITSFSDASEAPDLSGDPGIRYTQGPVGRGGASSLFAARGVASPRLSLISAAGNPALHIDATPGVPPDPDHFWTGFALGFGRDQEVCVDATGYRGVQFTLGGTTGTCQLMFEVQISQDYAINPSTQVAACALGDDLCYPPFSLALVVADGPRPYQFPFTALSEGSPVAIVDPKSITHVAWKLWAPLLGSPCVASLDLDDVAFFR